MATPGNINVNPAGSHLYFTRGGPSANCAVIGGGLAGLSLSILLAEQGWKVLLFEKNKYPFHKVCGEYISLESKPFLERIGLDLPEYKFPHINRLQVTGVSGIEVNRPLDLGGFGISRYYLDYQMALIAQSVGVTILQERVDDVVYNGRNYTVKTSKDQYTATACAGSFGKRSNLDVRFKRSFIQSAAKGLNNYLGIKYHIRYNHPKDLIALHNFKNGYCGISAIEDDRYCLCYLTAASNLADNENDIRRMEQNVLYQNRQLKKIFTEAEFLYKEPLVISQVSFADKSQTAGMMPLCGDAAGLITPLCGNGMSMAMKASSMMAPLIDAFLDKEITIQQLNKQYTAAWNMAFKKRLWLGRTVQSLFGSNLMTSAFLQTCKLVPALADGLIRNTHGQPF